VRRKAETWIGRGIANRGEKKTSRTFVPAAALVIPKRAFKRKEKDTRKKKKSYLTNRQDGGKKSARYAGRARGLAVTA